MNGKMHLILTVALALPGAVAFAQQADNAAPPRHLTLHEAVQLALQHNHLVRIKEFQVEEKQQAKQAEKSEYFPSIRNDSSFLHVTDTQLLEIGGGSLGTVAGTPIPAANAILNQGGRNLTTSGTQLTQPLTTLLKIRHANDIAQADLKASRSSAQQTENNVALKVHQIYYQILIEQVHRDATDARIKALQDLQNERVEQVKFGSTLEENLIESRAQGLQSKQELLTTDLHLTDLKLQFNDVLGLPLKTALDLDPDATEAPLACAREACVAEARAHQPNAEPGRRGDRRFPGALRVSHAGGRRICADRGA